MDFKIVGLIFFLKVVLGNPVLGLVDPNCIIVQSDKCPNENVSFWLYTNYEKLKLSTRKTILTNLILSNSATREIPVLLNPLTLNSSLFEPRRPVKIIIHGYTGHKDFAPNTQIRPALLDVEDLYVISVDYGPLVPSPCYFSAVKNLPIVSKCIAQLIDNLIDKNIVNNADIHVIGFSLGGQVAGQIANYVKHKIQHITGLDPAKPLFITVSSQYKLDSNDADFVDVVHTDVLGRGMLSAMGHVDFYPNIGKYQPGCEREKEPGSCNHERAPIYYAESIRNSNGFFWSYACGNWFNNLFGLCPGYKNDAVMGYHVNKSMTGSFFLKTADKAPFALGSITEISYNNMTSNDYYYLENMNDYQFEQQLCIWPEK